jgi:uncharacterized membrane protein YwzB
MTAAEKIARLVGAAASVGFAVVMVMVAVVIGAVMSTAFLG